MKAEEILHGMELPPCDGVVDRRTYVPQRARGCHVVHLGCVDEGLTAARASSGDLLHEELSKVAVEVTGVDLSAPGLAALEAVVPGRYLHGDVEDLDAIGLPSRCDLVVAGEIIEHLPSPGLFLGGLRRYLAQTGARAVLTTPNSYSWQGYLKFAATRREPTHPDHLAYYSPVTMVRTMRSAGLDVVSLKAHAWARPAGPRQRLLGLVDRTVSGWNPWMAVGLVVEVVPASDW